MSLAAEPSPLASPLELESAPTFFIDTHAHMHFDAYAGERDAVLHRAHEAGVTKIVTVGVTTADSKKAVELASTYENMWATVGIHPHEAGEAEQGIGYLRDLSERRKVVAIGECGFDFYKSETTKEQQERAVRLQIELALQRELPMIFHVREAFDAFFAVITDYPELRGVVHSFTAGRSELERIMATNLQVALNGIITFPKSEELRTAVRELPLDRLLLETDCPFLSPIPYRGKTNEPARIIDIAEAVAALTGRDQEVIRQATTANAETLFSLS